MAISAVPELDISAELLYGQMLIGGQWVDALDGERFDVENPSRREILGSVPYGTAVDCERAVAAAQAAFPAWAARSARERGALLQAIAQRVLERSEELARLSAAETGNALRTQTRAEAVSSADVIRYFGEVAGEQKGTVLPTGSGFLTYTRREPLGAVAAVIPWNSPVALAAIKIGAAIAFGNTIVLKPAEQAPLSALLFARICNEVLPDGVVNVVTGDGEVCGAALMSHPGVAKITFTGSTEVGRLAMRAAAERIVPVTLELGGKSPAIVCADSDDDATADDVIAAMRFTRQGQSCSAGSRLYVHSAIYDSFLERLSARLGRFVVGDALDERCDLGSLVSAEQFDRVINYLGQAFHDGGTPIIGGSPVTGTYPGYQLDPTVLTGVDRSSPVAREEVFGPVLVAFPWDDEHEVLAEANASEFGLAGFVWSRNIDSAIRIAHQLEVGFVQINAGGGPSASVSFGGRKLSGLGTEYSLEGSLDAFTHTKSVTLRLRDG